MPDHLCTTVGKKNNVKIHQIQAVWEGKSKENGGEERPEQKLGKMYGVRREFCHTLLYRGRGGEEGWKGHSGKKRRSKKKCTSPRIQKKKKTKSAKGPPIEAPNQERPLGTFKPKQRQADTMVQPRNFKGKTLRRPDVRDEDKSLLPTVQRGERSRAGAKGPRSRGQSRPGERGNSALYPSNLKAEGENRLNNFKTRVKQRCKNLFLRRSD